VNSWYTSKIFWGSLVTILGSLLGAFGIAITPEMQDQLVSYLVPAATGIGGMVSMIEHAKDSKKAANDNANSPQKEAA
jgi:hypothetical protein